MKTVREERKAGLCIHRCVCCDSFPSLLSLGAPHLAICSTVFLDFEVELSGL